MVGEQERAERRRAEGGPGGEPAIPLDPKQAKAQEKQRKKEAAEKAKEEKKKAEQDKKKGGGKPAAAPEPEFKASGLSAFL